MVYYFIIVSGLYVSYWLFFPVENMPNWDICIVVAGRYFGVMASLFAEKVSDRGEDNWQIYHAKDAEKQVTKSLLATMSVNRPQDTPFISVPSGRVCDSRPSHIRVEVEKLAGMY